VTDSGDASIAYVGDLAWGPAHLHYSSFLRSVGNSVTQRNSLRRPSLPVVNGSFISWNSAPFDFDAEWQADSTEVRETVFKNDEGSVDWRCLMPRAHVRAGHDSGLGYVEHLSMTIAPWKIPIQHLRWGRFCSASDWAVWIGWQGEFSKRILYLNGKSVPGATIEDEQITLRKGPLGTTALSSIPGVNKTFPARLLQVNECKWRSRARFESPGRSPVEGWALHEMVSWPK
jgi:hypothetical protein